MADVAVTIRKRFAIFFFTILIFLSFFSMIEYQIITNNERVYKGMRNQMKENEWKYVWSKISSLQAQAQESTDLISSHVREGIQTYYGSNHTALDRDLGNYNKDDNPIVNIIAKNILGHYLNKVVSDGDDMWAASRTAIISDFSVDCSAEGRTRSFPVEATLHYSPVLAEAAIDKILRMESGIIGWQFSKPVDPKFTFSYFNEASLKDLYMKYGLAALESFEVLVPSYIDPRIDLAGRYLIDEHGTRQTNDQIIITQGFNIVRQFNADHLIMVQLNTFEEQRKLLFTTYRTDSTLTIMLLLFTFAMSIMIVIVGNVLLYWETKLINDNISEE